MPGVNCKPGTNGVIPRSGGVLPGIGVSVRRARLRCIGSAEFVHHAVRDDGGELDGGVGIGVVVGLRLARQKAVQRNGLRIARVEVAHRERVLAVDQVIAVDHHLIGVIERGNAVARRWWVRWHPS